MTLAILAFVIAAVGFWFYKRKQINSLIRNIDDKQMIINSMVGQTGECCQDIPKDCKVGVKGVDKVPTMVTNNIIRKSGGNGNSIAVTTAYVPPKKGPKSVPPEAPKRATKTVTKKKTTNTKKTRG